MHCACAECDWTDGMVDALIPCACRSGSNAVASGVMRILTHSLRFLVLVTLVLNGAAAHGMQGSATGQSHAPVAKAGMPSCHTSADHRDAAQHQPAPHDRDAGTNHQAPATHHCGGPGCTCACAYHSPALSLFNAHLVQIRGAFTVLITPRVAFHSLTPLPLLRPPIA